MQPVGCDEQPAGTSQPAGHVGAKRQALAAQATSQAQAVVQSTLPPQLPSPEQSTEQVRSPQRTPKLQLLTAGHEIEHCAAAPQSSGPHEPAPMQ